MNVWSIYIDTLDGWQFVGYLKASEYATVEKHINALAARFGRCARAQLEE